MHLKSFLYVKLWKNVSSVGRLHCTQFVYKRFKFELFVISDHFS